MSAKRIITQISDLAGAFPLGQALRARRGAYVRVINYHGTPGSSAENFARHLEFYRRHFDDATPERLDSTLDGRASGPAVLLSFDDGFRSNYDVAAPLLEKYGFTGWFFVSSGRRRDGAAETADGEPSDQFMSSQEMRDLIARGHVVGCHTHSHRRLADDLDEATLDREIVASRAILQRDLGDPIVDFCWVGGEEWSYSAAAARAVERAGYRRAFMTNCQIAAEGTNPLAIQRTNIEADWPLAQVRFYLNGVMDLAYSSKRRRVATRLSRKISP